MLARPQKTLLALLALSSFVQAGWFEDRLNEVIRRQEDTEATPSISTPADSITPSVTPPVETDSSTSTPPISTTPSPTPTPTPSTTPSTTPSETPSSTTTTAPSTTPSSTSTTEEVSSSSSTSTEETSTPLTTPSPTVVKVTQITTVDGSVMTSISESTSTIKPSNTKPAELSEGSEESGGGMSSKTRSTVIGVVVGIGGAILLGGLAVVAWRIWGRKKSVEQGDEFMDYSRPDTGAEKSSSAGNSTNPFQSTLESYHNPAKVNASSNF